MLGGLAVAASAPVLAAGYWLTAGVRGPVTAAGPQILPPFVASSSSGPDRTRTLVLRPDGAALSYTVLRNTDPVLGEPELTEASSATHALNNVVASLGAAAGGDGGDAGQALSQFDIGYVLLPAPVDQTLARQLDGAAGLVRLTTAPAYDLWQVAGTVARARVNGADGTVVPVPSGPIGVNTVVPPGTSGTLVLAEAAGGWSATLNGRPLAKLTQPVDGWAQGFVLPAGGGHLVITRDELARDLSLGAEAAAVLIVFALALPGTRSAVPAPAAAGRSGAGPGARQAAGPRQRPEDGPAQAAAGVRPHGAAARGALPTPIRRPRPPAPRRGPGQPAAADRNRIRARALDQPRLRVSAAAWRTPGRPERPRAAGTSTSAAWPSGRAAASTPHGTGSPRGAGADRPDSPRAPSDDHQPPALENLDPFPADDEDLSPWVTHDAGDP